MKMLTYEQYINENFNFRLTLSDFEIIKDLPLTGFLVEKDHNIQAIALEYLFKKDYKLGATWNMWMNDNSLDEEKLLIPSNMKKLFDYTFHKAWFSEIDKVKINWWQDRNSMSGNEFQVIFEEFEGNSIDEKFHCRFDDYFRVKHESSGKYHSKKFNV